MKKKAFKDHITFFLDKEETMSNLGAKTLYKHKDITIPLRRISKNGEPVLVCSTEGLEKVDLQSGLICAQVTKVLKDLADLLAICEDSAFLDKSYVHISQELLFYKEKDNKYIFVVVPVDTNDYAVQQKEFEYELDEFVKELFSVSDKVSGELDSFRDEYLSAEVKSDFIRNEAHRLSDCDDIDQGRRDLGLDYNGAYGAFSLYVCKDEFVIGKSNDCDGVLNMNPTISRQHCKIRKTIDGWFVVDLGSRNGSFLNDMRLYPYQLMPIRRGDILRISDMNFIVRTG